MRSLGISTRILVASLQVATVHQLAPAPALATSDAGDTFEWGLESEGGATHLVRFEPRLGCSNTAAVRNAAADGMGVALLMLNRARSSDSASDAAQRVASHDLS